jgi:hypothetical protein
VPFIAAYQAEVTPGTASRRKTTTAKVQINWKTAILIASMGGILGACMAFRPWIIMTGVVLPDDRRMAASCIAAAVLQAD